MATSTPVLDLTTTAPQISIDGDLYDLRVREDLSILTNTEHARRFARCVSRDNVRRKKIRNSGRS